MKLKQLRRQLPLVVTAVTMASSSALPTGDADGDPSDWSGAPWIVFAVLALVLVVGGVLLARHLTHRKDNHR
jgi:predicted MFS family arabinose efflux permease